MKLRDAEDILREWDKSGRYVFLKSDLLKLFNEPSAHTVNQTIARLVKTGILIHAAHGVYIYAYSRHLDSNTLARIALALRRGHYVFESLESALSQWGDISQIPIDRITCMTTGRSGEYVTPFGTIEFTHTERSAQDIIANIVKRPGNPLPIATREFARANLKRVGRNMNMLQKGDERG